MPSPLQRFRSASLLLLAVHVPLVLSYLAAPNPAARRSDIGCPRCTAPRAAFAAFEPPDHSLVLKDALMKKAVGRQMEAFKSVGDTALQLWLKSKWDSFSSMEHETGKLARFLEELQRGRHTKLFVQTRSFKQGSPNNPYLKPKPQGYHADVEPPKVADKLMAVRKALAEGWAHQLHVIASGAEYAGMHDGQLLAGLATSTAVRALLHDLSMLPSQAHVLEWLSEYLLEHAKDMQADGDVEAMLRALADEPVRIRGAALLDPTDLAAQIRARRAEVATSMAEMLEGLSVEDLAIKSNFLDQCFQMKSDQLVDVETAAGHLENCLVLSEELDL